MKKVLAGLFAAGTALTSNVAFAGPLEDIQARLDAIERENAAIRKENAALRENKTLREQNTKLKTSTRAPEVTTAAPVMPASPAVDFKKDPFGAYAADLPVAYKARPAAAPGQFRIWGEGGAIWTGGDPVLQNYELVDFVNSPFGGFGGGFGALPGQFDLTPKIGWEAAGGFDYRFANSPWHVNGQFRYGEARNSGRASSSGVLDPTLQVLPPPLDTAVISGNQTISAKYRETHWLADLGAGYDVVGSGRSAMQVKGGLRVAEFVGRSNFANNVSSLVDFGGPVPLNLPEGGVIQVSSVSTTTTNVIDTRNSFLGAGPRLGIEGSVPFAGNWAFDYLGDLAVLFGTQKTVRTETSTQTITPAILGEGGGNDIFTSSAQRFATVLSADIQVGISYWITQNLKLGASYRLDALINVQNQSNPPVTNLTPDRYTHGPRLTLTGQFDSL